MANSPEPVHGLVKAHVLIRGLVQGVYFRDSARRVAQRERVAGWVRNLPDGRVEAEFIGPRAAVERLVTWCHQGPAAARIDHVAVQWSPAEPADLASGFRVR
jgi:acylphosphatase